MSYEKGKFGHRYAHRPYEDGGRDQVMYLHTKDAAKSLKPGKRLGQILPHSLRRNLPCRHWTPDFWPPELGDSLCAPGSLTLWCFVTAALGNDTQGCQAQAARARVSTSIFEQQICFPPNRPESSCFLSLQSFESLFFLCFYAGICILKEEGSKSSTMPLGMAGWLWEQA